MTVSGNENYRCLVIEDNGTMREGIQRVVSKLGHEVVAAEDAEKGIAQAETAPFDFMISDYKLPGMSGVELLEQVKSRWPQTEVLLITAFGSIELAVEAMQKGAADFITKPFSPDELNVKIHKIVERIRDKGELQRISEENRYLREQLEGEFNFGEIIGESPAIQSVFRTIEKVARGDSSVIIYGESGTGKELVARAIHKASSRAEAAFVRVNCGALAEGVLESELFGHERGSFTGALKRKRGRFELAHNGSIFLDEIGDIPLATQVKLLRVLQEREFERVGGEETLSVDVRVIAATNKNLQEEIKLGNFREDLYYRLHIIPIHLPPLRERKKDIPLLTEHFLRKVSHDLKLRNLRITPAAREKLLQYDWPGNIREFENIIERAAVLCENEEIGEADLPFAPRPRTQDDVAHELQYGDDLDLNRVLETTEKQLIERALEQASGVRSEAARILGVKTSAFYYKLEKYGLHSKDE